MTYRVGWGRNARHFAIAVATAKEAKAAFDSMQRYCQEGVVIVNDQIGEIDASSLQLLIAAEQAQALDRSESACSSCGTCACESADTPGVEDAAV